MALNSKTNMRATDTTTEVIVRAVSSLMEAMRKHNVDTWTGTMTELTSSLNRVLSKKQRSLLPGSPSALRVALNKIVNRLRSRGIGVRFGRTSDRTRTRFVKFAR